MPDPFLVRAFLAAVGLAIVAAPLGALIVWNRMAYFGESIAQAGLIGVAFGLLLDINLTLAVLLATLAAAGLLIFFTRQHLLPVDAVLGLVHQGALALGIIVLALIAGPSVDLMGYLFGDIFAVTRGDLWWIYGGGAVVLAVLAWLWQPLLRLAVHEELAAAEGVPREWVKAAFILLVALTVGIAIKIVGVLLVIAFLVVPAVAARPFAATPERMALLAALIGAASVVAGLGLSVGADAPGGPAIVLVMAAAAGLSLTYAAIARHH